ncbi:hypothetical protein ACUXCC_005587 [Cytobacillus horneckiae]
MDLEHPIITQIEQHGEPLELRKEDEDETR